MKNKVIKLALIFTAIAFTKISIAQEVALDTIFKVDNEIIVCNVSELNTTEVKYSYADRPNITLAIESELVSYVKLKTGETIKPQNNDEQITDIAYNKQHKMNIKLGFLTPVQGYTDIGFEYSRKPLQSLEGKLGLIGLGSDPLELGKGSGVSASFGYKVYAGPDFHLRKVRSSHRMSGLYMKPTIAMAAYQQNSEVYIFDVNAGNSGYRDVQSSVIKAALVMELGRQYIFNDIISLDFSVGAGYGMKQMTRNNWPEGAETFELLNFDRNYGLGIFSNSGLAFTSSLKMGVLLK